MNKHLKAFGVFMFYALVVGLLAYAGWAITKKVGKISSDIGSFIGGIIGFVLCIVLWIYFGKKLVEGSGSGDNS